MGMDLSDKDLIDQAAHYYQELNFNPNNTSNRVDAARYAELGHEINARGLTEELELAVKNYHFQPPAVETKEILNG